MSWWPMGAASESPMALKSSGGAERPHADSRQHAQRRRLRIRHMAGSRRNGERLRPATAAPTIRRREPPPPRRLTRSRNQIDGI